MARYGDLDELEEIFREVIAGIAKKPEITKDMEHLIRASATVIEIIKDQPTADVVERKRGKWIIKDNPGTGWYRVTCSECGEDVTSTIPVIGFSPNAKPIWNFCPDCGAGMRGEQDGRDS